MTDVAEAAAIETEHPTRPIGRIARLPLLTPLRIRAFRLVWIGESVSLLGNQFHYVALSWLVLGLTGSGLALGTVLFAAAVPRGAFLLLGGVLSDRLSPRSLMLGSNVIRAIITTAVAALVLGGRIEIWHLIVAGALFGTVDAFFYPAIGTIVARLVPADQLGPANALLQGTHQLMHTIGPALAGFAIAIIGLGAAFVVDAASFMVAAMAIWLVSAVGTAVPARPADPSSAQESIQPAAPPRRASVVSSLVEGTRVVMGDPVLRILVLLSTAFNLAFTGPFVVGLPWLVQFRFGGDAAVLGLLLGSLGGGSLLGVALAGMVPRTRGLGGLLLVVATGLGAGMGAIGIADAPAVALILFLIGSGTGYLNVSMITWTQARTEPALLGRTMSFMMLGSVVGAPVSLAAAGALVDSNATALFLGAGIVILATTLAGFASGLQRRMV